MSIKKIYAFPIAALLLLSACSQSSPAPTAGSAAPAQTPSAASTPQASAEDEDYEKMMEELKQLAEDMAPLEEAFKQYIEDNLPAEYKTGDKSSILDIEVNFSDRDIFEVSVPIEVHDADLDQVKKIVAEVSAIVEAADYKIDTESYDVYSNGKYAHMIFKTPYTQEYKLMQDGTPVLYTME